jgi:hypothetical protein
MRRGVWAYLTICGATLALIVGLSGCWNPFAPDKSGHSGPKIDRRTPDHLLNFLAAAYQDRSIDHYKEAVDFFYSFQFDPVDYDSADVGPDKPYWGRTEDVQRTEAMFTSVMTKAISMDLGNKTMRWLADTFYPDGETPVEGFTCEVNPIIDVTIEKEAGQELTIKQVRKSRFTIEVIPDRDYQGLWTILKITERVVD